MDSGAVAPGDTQPSGRRTPADLGPADEVPDLDRRVLDSLAREPMTRGALRDLLRVRNESLGEAIERLEAAGRVVRLEGRLAVPVPVP